MATITTRQAVLAAGGGVALGLAWLAYKSAGGTRRAPAYTETIPGPLLAHLVTEAELLAAPVLTPARYPARVGPGISALIAHGFAPHYQLPDPQAAAAPSEQAW